MRATDLARLTQERGWSRPRLVLELRKAAASVPGPALPADESLLRMLRQWVSGQRDLSERYAQLFSIVFGVGFEFENSEVSADAHGAAEFAERVSRANLSLDIELIGLFQQQTQSFRMIDRRLGARRLLVQTESHVSQMTDLFSYSLPGKHRQLLGRELAQGASLAGWQALDMGRPDKAWVLYETAKHAARESRDPALLAHVSAEQAYSLLDLGRPNDAARQIRHVRTEGGRQIPQILKGWLWAAEAEALAAGGHKSAARRALDEASDSVSGDNSERLPYLALDEVHLARWRGHCLARMGDSEAVDDLTSALSKLDHSFTRARAGLICDLAIAHAARGARDAAGDLARQAILLADSTASVRQRKRIELLLAVSEQSQ